MDGARRRVVVVLQGLDTSGKGGTIEHAIGLVNPQGVQIAAFKAPTEEERAHHFLWRVERQVPRPGLIGIFDRSHYEDVLVVRVNGLVPEAEWRGRYDDINAWEARLASEGVTWLKCFLHISAEEQRDRLLARLDDPAKHWKFKEDDLDKRARWQDYMAAYEDALTRCGTGTAPWYVIPADHKWYRNWAVSTLLLETLRELDPRWPDPRLDVPRLRRRLLDEDPLAADPD